MKAQTFISYSHKDIDIMKQVRHDIEALGIAVWTDEGIEPSSPSWLLDVENAIKASSCLVYVATPNAYEWSWVREELRFAVVHKKKIFLLLAVGTEQSSIPFGYTSYQRVDPLDTSSFTGRLLPVLKKLYVIDQTDLPQIAENTEEAIASSVPLRATSHQSLALNPSHEYVLSGTGVISVVQFTPDKRYLVASLDQDQVAQWKVGDPEMRRRAVPPGLEHYTAAHWNLKNIVISPDSRVVATSTFKKQLQLYELTELKPLKALDMGGEIVQSLAFSKDGAWLIAGTGEEGFIRIWSRSEDFRQTDRVKAHDAYVHIARAYPSTTKFITCGVDGAINEWSIEDEEIKALRQLKKPDGLQHGEVIFSPDGKLLCIGSRLGEIGLWRIEPYSEMMTWQAHDDQITALAFSPDGLLLCSVSRMRLRIWSIPFGYKLLSKKFEYPVNSVTFSPDGSHLAIAEAHNKIVRVYEITAS